MGGTGGTIQTRRDHFFATNPERLDRPPRDGFSKLPCIQLRASLHYSLTPTM